MRANEMDRNRHPAIAHNVYYVKYWSGFLLYLAIRSPHVDDLHARPALVLFVEHLE